MKEMREIKQLTPQEIETAAAEHMKEFKTGVMGSLDKDGLPYTSVVPVVKIGHKFYAYISETAPHYEFIKNNNNVDMMFAQDENQMKSSFLRKRLSYRLKCEFTQENDDIVNKFLEVHGDIVNMIRKMDFDLVEFQIQSAKFILGAGQAYFLNEKEEFIKQDTGKGNGHNRA